MRPYILSECNWKFIKENNFDVAILPWGATEAHNYHLPYGTDNYETERIIYESAKIAWEKGAKIIVMPTIPFGVNTGQKDIKLTVNLNPGTQLKILQDIAENLNFHNIHKLLIFNGHGGNDFKQIIREAGNIYPRMFICTCNWYQAIDKKVFFENDGDHADEMETSLMLHIAPEIILPLDQAGDGKYKRFNIQALNEPWAWTERKWTMVTKDTGIGNPHKATEEKGEKYLKSLINKISQLLIDLAHADIKDMYV
jgi:creatinine amidohydrolase